MRTRWFRTAIVVASLLSPLSVSAQEPGTAEIEVVPPHPTPDDAITIRLSGTWPDSCTPHGAAVSRSGPEISIELEFPIFLVCLQVLTPWALEVTIGQLPAGIYGVIVGFRAVEGPRIIGRAEFAVEAPSVGGVVMGVSPRRVVCWNLTTRRIIVIADGEKSWDCEGAGLRVRPGDRLLITISGRAD
jgi:hypothetical protein